MLLRAASSSAILPNRLLQRLPVRAVSQRTMAASTPVSSGLPDKIEDLFAATAGNRFANINRPTAGAREERALPEGSAPVQLYSLATPNGVKVSVICAIRFIRSFIHCQAAMQAWWRTGCPSLAVWAMPRL